MSDVFWLTEEQMERLQPFFPKPRQAWVDDRRVLCGIVFVRMMKGMAATDAEPKTAMIDATYL